MDNVTTFLEVAQQEGFQSRAAIKVFGTITIRMARSGCAADATFYVYRTSQTPGGEKKGFGGTVRPRWVLVFFSPDSALVFAQRHHVRPTPRLISMNLAQLLAILVKQDSIQALIFTEEGATISPDTHLPTILRLDRSELLDQLRRE
jgi:hypothetical protein